MARGPRVPITVAPSALLTRIRGTDYGVQLIIEVIAREIFRLSLSMRLSGVAYNLITSPYQCLSNLSNTDLCQLHDLPAHTSPTTFLIVLLRGRLGKGRQL